MATVVITATAQRQFQSLPRVIRARMERVFARLERWPAVSGVKPLAGELAGSFRVRTGDYRVQFRVVSGDAEAQPPREPRLIVEKLGHRDGFYED